MANGGAVDATDFTGVGVIHTVENAKRFGDNKIAGANGDLRTVHGRVGQSHGKQGFDARAQRPGGIHHAVEQGFVGNAAMLVKLAVDSGSGGATLYLRTRAIGDHQPHAQRMQQRDVVHNGGKAIALNGFATQYQHEYPVAVGIDIRRGIAKPFHVVAAVFHTRVPSQVGLLWPATEV